MTLRREFLLNRHIQFSRAIKNRLRPSILHLRLCKELCKRVAGSLRLTLFRERQRFPVVWIRELWIRPDCFFEVIDSLACLALLLVSRSQTVQGPRVIRVNFQSLPKEFFAGLQISFFPDIQIAQDNPTPRIFWVQT